MIARLCPSFRSIWQKFIIIFQRVVLTIEQILYIIEHYPKRFLCIRYPYQVAQTKK